MTEVSNYKDQLDVMNQLLLDPFAVRQLLEGEQGTFVQTGNLDAFSGLRIYLNHRLLTYKQWFEEDFPVCNNLFDSVNQALFLCENFENLQRFDQLVMIYLRNFVPRKRNRFDTPIEFIEFWISQFPLLGEFLALDYATQYLESSADKKDFYNRVSDLSIRFQGSNIDNSYFSFNENGVMLHLEHYFSGLFMHVVDHGKILLDTPSLTSFSLDHGKLAIVFELEEKAE